MILLEFPRVLIYAENMVFKGSLISDSTVKKTKISVQAKDRFTFSPSIRDGVLRSGMLLYLHHTNFKIFFHPAKFDNCKDEKISDFKTVSV